MTRSQKYQLIFDSQAGEQKGTFLLFFFTKKNGTPFGFLLSFSLRIRNEVELHHDSLKEFWKCRKLFTE